MGKAIAASKVRDDFAGTLNTVAYTGERVTLERHGKPVAAIIPIEDLTFLEEMEDRLDVEAARAALAESDERIPYEQVRRKLGLGNAL
jgi:prevent-host-death family protein